MEQFTPSVMTFYGWFHTAISGLAMFTGFAAVWQSGRIRSTTLMGRTYYITMLIGILSGLSIFHHGGFGIGHMISLAFLGLWAAACVCVFVKTVHGEILFTSLTYFLLWFFETTEFMTRYPMGHPYAKTPNDPALMPVRSLLLALLGLGLIFQMWGVNRRQKSDM